jgi:2-polyprenyl-3-methyl-5-hydroxy-6-metoxy-1,4-benzoquinol methylase
MAADHGDPARRHYERLAASYDQNWAYSPPYISWMTGRILDRAAIQPGETVADIGCGTGLYARGLAAVAGTVICADPSPAMLARLPGSPALVPVQASAQDVAAHRTRLPGGRPDVIIMKEAIHHVPGSERPATVAGLAGLLSPGGRILIIMLPARISYPLFTAALERFERCQPDPAAVAAMLRDAGLQTGLTYDSYRLSLPRQRYLAMVRDRYMSLLAAFSDAQIENGIDEIARRYPADRLEFDDTFAFIRGLTP